MEEPEVNQIPEDFVIVESIKYQAASLPALRKVFLLWLLKRFTVADLVTLLDREVAYILEIIK